MSLVTYDSSDEDVDEPEVEEGQTSPAHLLETQAVEKLAELPAPKFPDVSDEPEMIVVPSGKELSMREKPPPAQPSVSSVPPTRKKKLIQLPSVPIENSDDEEDEVKPSKPIVTSSKAGDPFGNFPKPKHSSMREMGRSLVPHVLTKIQEPKSSTAPHPTVSSSKSSQKSAATKNVAAAAADSTKKPPGLLTANYDSEDDDEGNDNLGSGFFSLESTGHVNRNVSSTRAISIAPVIDSFQTDVPPQATDTKEIAERELEKHSASFSSPADAPLEFQSKMQTNFPVVSSSSSAACSSYSSEGHADDWQYQSYSNEMQTAEDPYLPVSSEATDSSNQYQMPSFGPKRKRAKMDEIQVIEVNLADHMNASALELMKNATVEQTMKSHSKKRNQDMPTSQQKRKHQITYLAHQAKERELELKNQWAENKFSKKQTQSKYGF